MKKLFALFFGFLLVGWTSFSQNKYSINGITILEMNDSYYNISSPDTMQINPDVIRIAYDSGTTSNQRNEFEMTFSLESVYTTRLGNTVYKRNSQADFITEIQQILNQSIVKKLLFSFYIPYMLNPNDYYYITYPDDMWNLQILQMPDAWDITTGDQKVIVGIIDSGCEYGQEDIGLGTDNYSNIYVNPGELPDNHIDDDNNGKIDDWMGWDFVDNDNDVSPTYNPYNYDHGTLMTGVIAAKTNNNKGICGIAGGWNSRGISALIVRAGNQDGIIDAVVPEAIDYAVQQGAKVINMSWGGLQWYDEDIDDAINNAYLNHSITFFAPTGTTGGNSDIAWPAKHPFVIPVSGTTNSLNGETRLPSSDYSDTQLLTLISSPGVAYCTNPGWDPNDLYEIWTGTSISCASASAVTGLLLSVNPCLSPSDIKDILCRTADKVGSFNYNVSSEFPGRSYELGYGSIRVKDALLLAADPMTDITQNLTFDTPRWFTHNLTVTSGVTLTIHSKITMKAATKILVEKGARLIVDGGTITTTCGDYWRGIEIEGDKNLPQTPISNQGFVSLINGAVIEKAYCGVITSFPDPQMDDPDLFCSSGGGIVTTDSASFFNCYVTVNMGEYPYHPSISEFNNTIFKSDDNGFNPSILASFVVLNQVRGVKYKKCQFLNQTSYASKGWGIKAFNSSFLVDGKCLSYNQDDCNDFEPSLFSNLLYGIYVTNGGTTDRFTVRRSVFIDNYKGIFVSGVDYETIVTNIFNAKQMPQSYGLYLDNSTGYHIEDNTFNGSDGQMNQQIGLYIRNSGDEQNWVYNNRFNNLYCGAIADGYNRNYMMKTGLCFKCNDFSGNYDDIYVTTDDGIPPNIDEGIAQYQGYYYPNDSSPAGNTFSYNSNYSIENIVNSIIYNYHEHDGGYKIEPNPVTALVGKSVVPNTTYIKSVSCKSWLHKEITPPTEELKQQMNQADSGSTALQFQLQSLTDGGNTGELNAQVLLTPPDSAFSLYSDLLAKSPFLSDTVMKSSVTNEEVLSSVMLRDILVANPQSAKSTEVMNSIDNRVNPLTIEMKDEIAEGIDILGGKDVLEMNIAKQEDDFAMAYQTIQRFLLTDSVNPTAGDSLRNLLSQVNRKEAKYRLYLSWLTDNNPTQASLVLNTLPSIFSFTIQDQLLYDDFTYYNNRWSIIHTAGKSLINYNDALLDDYFALAEKDLTKPGAFARNILIANHKVQYEEPLNLPPGNIPQKLNRIKSDGLSQEPNALRITPNPANNYFISSYEFKSSCPRVDLRITDAAGKLITEMPLAKVKDQIVIDCRSFKPGIYIISLLQEGKTVANGKLIKQ